MNNKKINFNNNNTNHANNQKITNKNSLIKNTIINTKIINNNNENKKQISSNSKTNAIKNKNNNNNNNAKKTNINKNNSNSNIIITNISNKQKTFRKTNNLPPIKTSLLSSTINNQNNILNTSKDSTKAEIDFLKTKSNKFEIDCDSEKILDNEFLQNLSQNEKNFFQTKAKEIYDFLESINLIRFIESFINDGFEGIVDLMEIKKDYFEENKNFTPAQQKRILEKAEEYSQIYKDKISKNKNNNVNEVSCGTDEINENEKISNRCWTCFKKLEKNYIEKEYKDSIVKRKVRFCSKKCMEIFETNIYTYCDECNQIFDKSKGDFVFQKFHFHSKECLNKFLNNNNIDNNSNNYYNNIENSFEEEEENENKIYDPMDDF